MYTNSSKILIYQTEPTIIDNAKNHKKGFSAEPYSQIDHRYIIIQRQRMNLALITETKTSDAATSGELSSLLKDAVANQTECIRNNGTYFLVNPKKGNLRVLDVWDYREETMGVDVVKHGLSGIRSISVGIGHLERVGYMSMTELSNYLDDAVLFKVSNPFAIAKFSYNS